MFKPRFFAFFQKVIENWSSGIDNGLFGSNFLNSEYTKTQVFKDFYSHQGESNIKIYKNSLYAELTQKTHKIFQKIRLNGYIGKIAVRN